MHDMYASQGTEMASVTVQSRDVISRYSESILVPLLQWREARTSSHGAMREVGEIEGMSPRLRLCCDLHILKLICTPDSAFQKRVVYEGGCVDRSLIPSNCFITTSAFTQCAERT